MQWHHLKGKGQRLDVPLPKEMRFLAVEVADPYHFREGLTAEVEASLSAFVERAAQRLKEWNHAAHAQSLNA